MGPEALRVADIGPVLAGPRPRGRRPRQPRAARPTRGSRRPTATATSTRSSPGTGRVHDAVHAELAAGPACRSCSAATTASGIGSISAVARHCRETNKKLRVLWLDAHADFNTNVLTPSGNMHGMPVACLCGHGPQELIEIGGTGAGDQPEVGAPDRHPQRRRRREAPRARDRTSRCSTCATSTRWACATRWSWRWRRSTPTPTCTSASTSTSSTPTSRPASAPPSRAARPTARRSCAWR